LLIVGIINDYSIAISNFEEQEALCFRLAQWRKETVSVSVRTNFFFFFSHAIHRKKRRKSEEARIRPEKTGKSVVVLKYSGRYFVSENRNKEEVG
jgi:hypothetical protein